MNTVAEHSSPLSSIGVANAWGERLRNGIWPRQFVVWVAAFYMALFILRPWETLVPELASIRFERWMVLFVIAIIVYSRGFAIRIGGQSLALVATLGAVWLSTRHAYNPIASSEELTEFVGLAISFFVIQKVVRTPYQLLFLVACFFLATCLYVFKSEWEFFVHGNGYDSMGVLRMKGIDLTYGHPNSLGSKILCSLPFLVFFHRAKDQFCVTWPSRLKLIFVWIIYAYAVGGVVGILLTRSRTAILGLVLYAALIVLRQQGLVAKLKWASLAAATFLVLFMVSPENVQKRIRSTWDRSQGEHGANRSAEGRIEGLKAGLEIFKRFPVSGVGIGSFRDYRRDHVDGVDLDAHNLPGELLGTTGSIGCAAFFTFIVCLWRNCARLRRLGGEMRARFGIGIYAMLATACTEGLLLLIWSSIAGHTLQLYEWYWFAAFALAGIQCATEDENSNDIDAP